MSGCLARSIKVKPAADIECDRMLRFLFKDRHSTRSQEPLQDYLFCHARTKIAGLDTNVRVSETNAIES